MIGKTINYLKIRKMNNYFKNNYGLTPIRIRIETTNRCNLRCTTCPLQEKDYNRKKVDMSDKLFNKIVDDAKNIKPKPFITLYVGGEPLLNKKIYSQIRKLKKEGFHVHLNTNATLLNHDNCYNLVKSGIDSVDLSFDDVSKEEFKKMRVGSDYDKTLSNIYRLINVKKELKSMFPLIDITGLRLKDGEMTDGLKQLKPRKSFTNKFKGYDVTFTTWYAHKWTGAKVSKYSPCDMVYRDFTILSDGKVVPCCNDLKGGMIMGDINENTIMEVWANERYKELRRALDDKRHNEYKLCSGCPTYGR